MHIDTAVLTGTHHLASAKPCQDYCLGGALASGRVWGAVADGCSTGGHTDLGARAWALALRETLVQEPEARLDEPQHLASLLARAEHLLESLAFEDGYATLGVLQASTSEVRATLFGDGVLIARHTDGAVTFVNVEYSDNAPFYLNYLRKPDCLEQWRLQYGSQERRIVHHLFDAAGELTRMTVLKGPPDVPWVWVAQPQADDLDLVLLATDGALTTGAALFTAVRELAAVKSGAGEFMKRRLAKLARQWQKADQMPGDDLAVAALWLGSEPAYG